MKRCPHCAEEIQQDAVMCRYCGRRVERRFPRLHRPRLRTTLLAALALAVAGAGIAAGLILARNSAPSAFLYSDAEKAYYLSWGSGNSGTLWATYVNPVDTFRVESQSEAVTVTVQGSAVSVQLPGAATPSLGQRTGASLSMSINANAGFGPWFGNFTFSPGSLQDFETEARKVQETGTSITREAATYAAQDVADANAARSVSTDGDCILYLSGTDVSITMHGAGDSGCSDLTSSYGGLGSGGSWASQQIGANYPGEASLVCEDANDQATTLVTVADAGGRSYGSELCADLASGGGWFSLK